tara:strand:+ start:892 stop:1107 length:216 start_codon:yes stop_codon:yes gene_type:complete
MPKLKERQFYNVGTRKKEMIPAEYISVVQFKNGNYALLGIARNDIRLFKIFSDLKLEKYEKKYGKSRRYRR